MVRVEPEAEQKYSSMIRAWRVERQLLLQLEGPRNTQKKSTRVCHLSILSFIFWRGLETHILSSSVTPCYALPICQMRDRVLYYISINDAT